MLADNAADLIDKSRDWGGGRSWFGFIGLCRELAEEFMRSEYVGSLLRSTWGDVVG